MGRKAWNQNGVLIDITEEMYLENIRSPALRSAYLDRVENKDSLEQSQKEFCERYLKAQDRVYKREQRRIRKLALLSAKKAHENKK